MNILPPDETRLHSCGGKASMQLIRRYKQVILFTHLETFICVIGEVVDAIIVFITA